MVANGDRHCRQWMSPLAIVIAIGTTHRIAIGANGASIGATHCRHWHQWHQMIHSPNLLTLSPNNCSRCSFCFILRSCSNVMILLCVPSWETIYNYNMCLLNHTTQFKYDDHLDEVVTCKLCLCRQAFL